MVFALKSWKIKSRHKTQLHVEPKISLHQSKSQNFAVKLYQFEFEVSKFYICAFKWRCSHSSRLIIVPYKTPSPKHKPRIRKVQIC